MENKNKYCYFCGKITNFSNEMDTPKGKITTSSFFCEVCGWEHVSAKKDFPLTKEGNSHTVPVGF